MTVISTVISRYCTAHASDSLITQQQPDGSRRPTEWKRTKIIPVRHWYGALSYWGLARRDGYGWSTVKWLEREASGAHQFSSAEAFAHALADQLNIKLSQMRFAKTADAGIGIHFTAYERVEDYWVPELFQLTNFADTSYTSLSKEGVRVTRETFHTMNSSKDEKRPEHREPEYRLAVHHWLQDGNLFLFNNGDPIMFNPVASALFKLVETLAARHALREAKDIETYRHIAKLSVEVVADVQRRFGLKRAQLVGGRVHDLVVTPSGVYTSGSGDA